MGNQQQKKEVKKVTSTELQTYVMVVQAKITQNRNKKVEMIRKKRKEIISNLQDNNLDIAKAKMDSVLREEDYITVFDILGPICEILKEKVTYLLSHDKCPDDLRATLDTIVYAATRLEIEELHKIREIIRSKYGEIFVSKADMNADSLVNVNVVDKLKIKPATDQYLIARLKLLCREENIVYDFPQDVIPTVNSFENFDNSSVGNFNNFDNQYSNHQNNNQDGQNYNNFSNSNTNLPQAQAFNYRDPGYQFNNPNNFNGNNFQSYDVNSGNSQNYPNFQNFNNQNQQFQQNFGGNSKINPNQNTNLAERKVESNVGIPNNNNNFPSLPGNNQSTFPSNNFNNQSTFPSNNFNNQSQTTSQTNSGFFPNNNFNPNSTPNYNTQSQFPTVQQGTFPSQSFVMNKNMNMSNNLINQNNLNPTTNSMSNPKLGETYNDDSPKMKKMTENEPHDMFPVPRNQSGFNVVNNNSFNPYQDDFNNNNLNNEAMKKSGSISNKIYTNEQNSTPKPPENDFNVGGSSGTGTDFGNSYFPKTDNQFPKRNNNLDINSHDDLNFPTTKSVQNDSNVDDLFPKPNFRK